MTLTELRYIVTLARERHFGRAAEKCNVSQPTLSVALKKFEQRYGALLFERTSTERAPWHVVPANAKWYARLAVQALVLDTLERIDPQWPAADFDVEAEKARLAAT